MKTTIRNVGRIVALLLLSHSLIAQDTRNVTKPVLPPICAALNARLSAGIHGLPAADETKLDTARIQKAIDGCTPGHGVELRPQGANNAFLSGPIQLRRGITLIVDKGAMLLASRDAALYAITPGSCGIESHSNWGCKPLIAVDHVSGAGVMGGGVIDGRGGDKLLGKDFSWWELGLRAKKSKQHARMQQVCPLLIGADYANNFTLYKITLKNAMKHNIVYDHGDGFTVWGVKIDTPMWVNGKRVALNTDGVDPGEGSKNITITHSYIRDGDDNIAITSGTKDVTVSHDHFYWGHGMSIGSVVRGGVSKIRVYDLSLDGSVNGIRIKSNSERGGLVQDVTYDDICIRNTHNPIEFMTSYAVKRASYSQGNTLPEYRDITLRDVRISGGGKITFSGYSHKYRIGVTLDGVLLTDGNAKYTYSIRHTDFHLGPGPVNLQLRGPDTTISGKAGSGSLKSCTSMFVPFPQ